MKTVLKRLLSVFGGNNDNDSSVTTEVPGQQLGSNEFERQPGDDHIMNDVKKVDGHLVTTFKLDGGQAHPVWARSVAAEKRRAQLGRWYLGN